MGGVFKTLIKPKNLLTLNSAWAGEIAKKTVQKITAYDQKKEAQAAAEVARKEALTQEAEIAARQQENALALQNMQANAQVDLNTDNLTSVIAGGTADLSTSDSSGLRKKRATSSGLASSLGLNV